MRLKPTLAALLIATAQTAGAEAATPESLLPGDVDDSVALVLATEPARSLLPGLMAYFPAEGMAMIDNLRALVGGPEPLSAASISRLGELNARTQAPIMAMVAQAPDADLVALIDDQIGMLRGLQAEPMLCARFVVQGPGALGTLHRYVVEGMLEEAFRHRFAIARENRDSEARRGMATDADYAAFGQALAEAGADDAWFDRLEAMNPGDRALCRTFEDYLTVARDADFPGADRIRADLATVTGLF